MTCSNDAVGLVFENMVLKMRHYYRNVIINQIRVVRVVISQNCDLAFVAGSMFSLVLMDVSSFFT